MIQMAGIRASVSPMRFYGEVWALNPEQLWPDVQICSMCDNEDMQRR